MKLQVVGLTRTLCFEDDTVSATWSDIVEILRVMVEIADGTLTPVYLDELRSKWEAEASHHEK